MGRNAAINRDSIKFIALYLTLAIPTFSTPVLSAEVFKLSNTEPPSSACQQPVLNRLQRHQVAPGETLASIARQYNLQPSTLISLNSLRGNYVAVGTQILIPPFNGIRIRVPNGARWTDLSSAYGLRADVLFEINGCQAPAEYAFIPGVHGQSTQGSPKPQVDNYSGLATYPLPQSASVGLAYGWYTHPQTQEQKFHSGVDLLVASGTNVLAADSGTVVFVGSQGGYGTLVVINHSGGRQTRYAHLASTTVQAGQTIQAGEMLGTVGASGQPDIEQSHLHFEVRQNFPVGWVAQDPVIHLK